MRFSIPAVVVLTSVGLAWGQGSTPPRPAPAAPAPATATTGSIHGVVRDEVTGDPAVGVTVTVTSPALAGTQTAITDEQGRWVIPSLPPGVYLVTYYYLDVTVERMNVTVAVNQVTSLAEKLPQPAAGGETISITDSAPSIDPTSTTTGVTIDQNYIRTIPVGRTFSSTIGSAAGSQGDGTEPRYEQYARIDDNPFHRVEAAPLSTFSIDVDTASFSNVRRFLTDGRKPPPDAVRVEEMLNYFRYAYPVPRDPKGIAVTTEVGPAPWNPAHRLVRVGVQTAPIADDRVPPRNLIFLLDVSGSMADPAKLPLLKLAMGLVVDTMRPDDTIGIVVYAGASGVALMPTTGRHKPEIRAALAALEPGGSTNGAAGIEAAYELARMQYKPKGINRVILCTDGDFNVGVTSEGDLTRLIEREREHGVFLTVLGFGMGNLKDSTMESLADRGNGNYGYIDTLDEARKLLVKEAGATLVTVAKDVKIQVEMNPALVAGYRLIGYENRLLADEDFDNDAKDAGEMGAGHSVTALYEIVPVGMPVPTTAPVPTPKKYQSAAVTAASASTELMMVKVRFKAPDGKASRLLTHVVTDRTVAIDSVTDDFRWASAVAGFGMLLRGSPQLGQLSWPLVSQFARSGVGPDREGYRRQFLGLLDEAARQAP